MKLRTEGRGVQGHCVRIAYTGGGGLEIGKILRTYFMDGPLMHKKTEAFC